MNKIIKGFSLIIIASFLLPSCSSEEEIDFSGEYRTTLLETFDCVDPSSNGRSFTANASNNFCQAVGDTEECFRIIITINSDGSFEYVYSENTIRGTVSVGGPVEVLNGSYTSEGRDILMCPSDGTSCLSMTMNEGNQTLEWINPDSNCSVAYTFTRS